MIEFRRHCVAILCCLWVTSPAKTGEPPGPNGLRHEDGSRLLPLGESCYRIPEWNAALFDAAPLPRLREPRRSTDYLLLKFRNTEIASRVQGYELEKTASGRPVEALLIGVRILHPGAQEQRRSNESRMHLDLLYAGPGHESRIVQPIPGSGLYRLFDAPDKTSWMIATRPPDMQRRDTHEGGDLWVAACAHFSWQRTLAGQCKTGVERGGFGMSFSTLEENVLKRGEIADYVIAKLVSWKSPCS